MREEVRFRLVGLVALLFGAFFIYASTIWITEIFVGLSLLVVFLVCEYRVTVLRRERLGYAFERS